MGSAVFAATLGALAGGVSVLAYSASWWRLLAHEPGATP
jgi:hypothetical protein